MKPAIEGIVPGKYFAAQPPKWCALGWCSKIPRNRPENTVRWAIANGHVASQPQLDCGHQDFFASLTFGSKGVQAVPQARGILPCCGINGFDSELIKVN